MNPLKAGPKGPEKKPYAVKTIPKTLPKFWMPKQSVTNGADTVNKEPNAKPMSPA